MSENIYNLEMSLNKKNPTSTQEMLYHAKLIKILKTGVVRKVDEFFNLPNAVENESDIYLVNNENLLYYSNGRSWEPMRPFNSELWTWGFNHVGQLGDGTIICRSLPGTTISGGADWYAIAAGDYHSLAIKTDGTLWTWGYNFYGQLGDGSTTWRSSPGTTIYGGTDWCAVAGGRIHSLAIKTDGTLWTWGYNLYGQLGDGTLTDRSSPGTTLAGGADWCAIAAGLCHSVALKTDGTLWTWGYNLYGQLGDGTVICRSLPGTTVTGGTDWCAIAGGWHHSIGLKTDGTLWTWGQNNLGQLGNGVATSRSSPGTTLAGGTDWYKIAGGGGHLLALKTDGTLWTWGYNAAGQLGDGTTTTRYSPGTTVVGGTDWCTVAAGDYHSLAIKTDGTLWTWGLNCYGELGDGTITPRSSPGTTAAGGTDWCAISGSYHKSVALEAKK